MAKTLQQIRKDAGFRSAREFAESAGIPVSTYTRYEQSPDTIPIKAAWDLADRFGCSIDAVVGRVEPEPDAMRGEVQRFHDSLSGPNKKLHDEFMAFLAAREADTQARIAEAEEMRRWAMFETMETLFMVSVAQSGKILDSAFTSAEDRRSQFEAFVRECVEEGKIEPVRVDGKEAVEGYMADYDERHARGSGRVNYSIIEF